MITLHEYPPPPPLIVNILATALDLWVNNSIIIITKKGGEQQQCIKYFTEIFLSIEQYSLMKTVFPQWRSELNSKFNYLKHATLCQSYSPMLRVVQAARMQRLIQQQELAILSLASTCLFITNSRTKQQKLM